MRSPRRRPLLLLVCATCALILALASAAQAAPLPGSAYDTGDGNQDNALGLDWQGAHAAGVVQESRDANDDCFVGGVKELTPNQWAFNTSAGGCTPGKSNVRVAYANAESGAATTFGHFGFFRNDTTGNTFLTFELNKVAATWVNATGTTIPCRANGDVLLSFEVGGSSLTTTLYRWAGDGTGPASCRDGANGTFISSGPIPGARFQGAMNAVAAIANYVNPAGNGALFPANSFGEAAIDLPAVLQTMGQSPCFGFLQMQVHTRSSSSISSAMIDYAKPVPVRLQSCAVTGTQYQDTNGNGTRDAGEPGVAGFEVYADLDDDGTLDAGEPSATSDATGLYRILDVPAGSFRIREVARSGWRCSQPSPCSYSRSLVAGGNSTGNDFGNLGPSRASGTAFEDLDADGTRDDGEPPRTGTRLYVDLDDDGVADAGEPLGTSDATGAWAIEDIPAGTYRIREAAQAGWTCSAPVPCSTQRTFSSGSAASGLVFGAYAAATLTGNLFEDVDGNGAAQAPGDADLAGWQVYLDANANAAFDLGERQATTDASGDYAIAGLAPGAHTVRVAAPSASWYCTRPSPSAAACAHAAVLTSGQTASGNSFGFTRTATVAGTKFGDVDGNGIKDGSDGALGGFTFWVDYDNDNAVDADEPSGTSDSAGNWAITGVRAGSWTLREVPNGAYACTKPSPCTYALTLASNGSASGHQFGNHVSRSVSGVVFNDADADALNREPGEAGLSGWLAYSDANNNATPDAGEPRSTTNSAGQYNLTGLANGNYKIRLVAQTGWTCSYPVGCAATGSIGSGQSDGNVNFGVWGPSSIGGTVFEDADADGAAREAGEEALSGRVVYVDGNANGTRDGGEPSATSDGSGAYSIAGINPGTYVVRQVLPAGWVCSRPAPCSFSVTISAGNAGERDFGSYTTGQIAGGAYEDADANGAQDAGEPALAGRTIYLDADDDGTKDAGETAATTDASGDYTFSGLQPGPHKVRQVLPAGWTQSAPASAQTLTVSSGATGAAAGLGSYGDATISGAAFQDSDFDGSAREAGDTAIAGRPVYLDADADGAQDDGERATTTDAAGAYTFSGLQPGSYTVRFVAAANWACAHPQSCSRAVTATSQAAATGEDFGAYLGASVAGTVFDDLDADGAAREPGEHGLGGRRVYLDADADAVRDAGEPTTLTDSAGDYAFGGVVARSWTVRLELDGDWSCDSPAGCAADLTLASGAARAGVDFGVHTTGAISGHLFTDRDNDGQAQVFGENDQPGRTVYVDSDDDGTRDGGEPAATTDDNGDYTIDGLQPGTHRVRQVLPSDWTCATPDPCSRLVTLASGGSATGNDFSSWTAAALSGTYFEDRSGDGDVALPGEPGIAGRTVYVDTDGDAARDAGEPTATTAGDGSYAFADLSPGTYVVRSAAQPDGWTCSYPSACAQALTLEASERAQDVNFAAWTTGTVAGVAYEDSDSDGARDAGEPGLSGRTIYADRDDDGTKDAGEPSASTDVAGGYELTLAPGPYKLRTTGLTCTAPAPCVRSVGVTSQGALTGADFAFSAPATPQPASVAGTVYVDRDADGTRDAGDDGREGVTVWVDYDGDGELDAAEPRAATAAGGGYAIAGVDAGTWPLAVAPSGDWRCSTPADCARSVALDAGDAATGLHFGTWQPATIGGEIYDDTDGDGAARETGDAPLSALVELELGGAPAGSTTSSATSGGYELTAVRPGTYTLQADLGARTCTRPAGCARTVTVQSGEQRASLDFAGYAGASIAGTVSSPSGPLPGRTVYLDTNGDGGRDAGEPTATTAADGTYDFAGLAPGAHVVRLELPATYACSAPDGCSHAPELASGEAATSMDFVAYETARIAGTVVEDLDADGTIEAGEEGFAGRTVYLDGDGDGARDADEPATTTGADGTYTFTGLQPGARSIRLALPATITCSAPADCGQARTLGAGTAATGVDFAAWRAGSAAGLVFNDIDGDGSRGAAEPVRAGASVRLDLDDDGAADAGEPSTTTAADGRYAFEGLRPGTYALRVIAPAESSCTPSATCRAGATVLSGRAAAVADVGLHKPGPTASDEQTSGASGMPQTQTLIVPSGGSVTLLDDEGAPTLRVVRAGQGEYVLDPLTGIVTFTPLPGFSGAAQPVSYRVTDAEGATADATYAASVQPAAPAAAAAPVTQQPAAAATAAPAPPAPAATAPSCFSRRAMTINWIVQRSVRLRSIRVTVNGRLYARLAGSARKVRIDMRGRPRQTVKIRITARGRDGRRFATRRTYRTCRPYMDHPPLPTLRLRPVV